MASAAWQLDSDVAESQKVKWEGGLGGMSGIEEGKRGVHDYRNCHFVLAYEQAPSMVYECRCSLCRITSCLISSFNAMQKSEQRCTRASDTRVLLNNSSPFNRYRSHPSYGTSLRGHQHSILSFLGRSY